MGNWMTFRTRTRRVSHSCGATVPRKPLVAQLLHPAEPEKAVLVHATAAEPLAKPLQIGRVGQARWVNTTASCFVWVERELCGSSVFDCGSVLIWCCFEGVPHKNRPFELCANNKKSWVKPVLQDFVREFGDWSILTNDALIWELIKYYIGSSVQ